MIKLSIPQLLTASQIAGDCLLGHCFGNKFQLINHHTISISIANSILLCLNQSTVSEQPAAVPHLLQLPCQLTTFRPFSRTIYSLPAIAKYHPLQLIPCNYIAGEQQHIKFGQLAGSRQLFSRYLAIHTQTVDLCSGVIFPELFEERGSRADIVGSDGEEGSVIVDLGYILFVDVRFELPESIIDLVLFQLLLRASHHMLDSQVDSQQIGNSEDVLCVLLSYGLQLAPQLLKLIQVATMWLSNQIMVDYSYFEQPAIGVLLFDLIYALQTLLQLISLQLNISLEYKCAITIYHLALLLALATNLQCLAQHLLAQLFIVLLEIAVSQSQHGIQIQAVGLERLLVYLYCRFD